MDALDRVLDISRAAGAGPAFVPSAQFAGRRDGYVFKNGDKGIGYYLDEQQTSRKRAREQQVVHAEEDDDDDDDGIGLDRVDIKRLVDEAEDIKALDAASLKALLIKFEKKINHNQEQRIKFSQAPEKFMDSELELHETVKELQAVAASPKLYPILLQCNSLESILGLVTHENTDVSMAAIALLQELTEADDDEDEEDEDENGRGANQQFVAPLVQRLLDLQCLELVVANLDRLDEAANDDDAQGVHSTLMLVENVVSLEPKAAELACERTPLLRFLARRLQQKAPPPSTTSAGSAAAASFDANKLYSSEILSILLQAAEANRLKYLQLQQGGDGLDGLECLLQALASYKKRDPASNDEAEFVQNVFLSLRAVLLQAEGQDQFRTAEGFELMVRFLKEQKFCAAGALRAISFAVVGHRENCLKLVEAGGLRFVFPALMGIGVPKAYLEGDSSEAGVVVVVRTGLSQREVVEAAAGTVSQLVLHLYQTSELDAGARLAAKLEESSCEKALRCVELFVRAAKRLQSTERGIARDLQAAIAQGDDSLVQQYSDEDVLYALRLQGGLGTLQQLALLVAFAFLFVDATRVPIQTALVAEGGEIADVLAVLRERAAHLDDDDDEGEGAAAAGARPPSERQTLVQWCAALAQLAQAS